jgi:hypothetical protein
MEPENPPFRVRPLPKRVGLQDDRRHRRSSSSAVALELALTSAAARGKLDALILVDDDGMLVSRNRTSLDLSMLAAVTPIVGRGQAVPKIKRDGKPLDLTVSAIELEGETFYVAALGGTFGDRRRELAGSIAAARRILA